MIDEGHAQTLIQLIKLALAHLKAYLILKITL